MKPDAIEMLKLDPDAFMVEVSRAISPKPWTHDYGDNYPRTNCLHCGKYVSDMPCECVPPPITDHPAVVAETLRNRCMDGGENHEAALLEAVGLLCRHLEVTVVYYMWFGFLASPAERITVCLVALGHWQIKEKP